MRLVGPALLPQGGLARLAPCARFAYFLDVDGTLLEIMPRPEDVAADEPLRALLSRLWHAAGGALGLVSGRTLTGIDRIFAPLVLPAVGVHGAEIRFPDGSRETSSNGAMDKVRAPLAEFAAARPGLRIEDKGSALAVHFRQAPEHAGEVLAFVQSLAQHSGLAVQPGKMVAELKDARHDKGKGIARLLARPPFYGRKPLFIGDDLTDESGFALVNALDGISVRAGGACHPTQARYRLPDPASVRTELRQLVEGG